MKKISSLNTYLVSREKVTNSSKFMITVNNGFENDHEITQYLHENHLAPPQFTYTSTYIDYSEKMRVPVKCYFNPSRGNLSYKPPHSSPTLLIASVPKLTKLPLGVFTLSSLPKGSFVGPLISEMGCIFDLDKTCNPLFTTTLTPIVGLNYNFRSNWVRFLNGSDKFSNLGLRPYLHQGIHSTTIRFCFVTIKDVESGEQLLLNYKDNSSEYIEMGRPSLDNYEQELKSNKILNPEQNRLRLEGSLNIV